VKKIRLLDKNELLERAGPELAELADMIEHLPRHSLKRLSAHLQLYGLVKHLTKDELWRLIGWIELLIRRLH